MFENLTEDNFQMFAMKTYTNPHCTDLLEFQDDLKRIRYIKRLFKKYSETGELRERLVLNHLIVIYNMFESRAATRMLFLKLEGYYDYLKPFLIFLGYWPAEIGLVDGVRVLDTNISLDDTIVSKLKEI
jgi:hypothetical protein|tara:strand:+ start:935 stop:1321 length:387 start_codon:yes stop_codon:yes gene_type:complete